MHGNSAIVPLRDLDIPQFRVRNRVAPVNIGRNALRADGYRQIRVKKYILVYRVDEVAGAVRILHVYHESQDYFVRLLASGEAQ